MNVRPLGALEDAAWDTYVRAHPHGTMFHQTRWRDLVIEFQRGAPCYLVCEESGVFRGVLPLFRTRTLSGRALVSVPFAVYGGVLADSAEAERMLKDAAREERARFGARYVELRSLHAPESADLPTTDRYVTFRRDLPSDPQECLGLIPRKSRAAARQARDKHGLTFSDARGDVAAFHELFVANKRALGSPVFSRSYFDALLERLGADALLHAVHHDGQIIAAVFSFLDGDVINPYYSGSLPGTERLGSMNFMYWQLMEEGVRRGARRYDFGRSRAGTGAFKFKENMGFEATPLHYQYILGAGGHGGVGEEGQIPSVNPSNPRFDLVKAIWSRLPMPVVKALGPRLMRLFP